MAAPFRSLIAPPPGVIGGTMEEDRMSDPLDQLAVGVAADHQADKRRKGKGGAAATEPTANTMPAEGDGAAELREAVASLGEKIGETDEDASTPIELAVERFESLGRTAELDAGTLTGDLRDAMLDIIKANPKPWGLIQEADQKRIADGLMSVARSLVGSVLMIVAERDAAEGTIAAKLESYGEKGGLKIALTATSDDATVLALHKAVGQRVIVKRVDTNVFDGSRREPEFDPDEPGLQFEGGEGTPPADRSDDDLTGVEE